MNFTELKRNIARYPDGSTLPGICRNDEAAFFIDTDELKGELYT